MRATAAEETPPPSCTPSRPQPQRSALAVAWHSPWSRLVRRILLRIAYAIPLLLGVLTITFVVTRALGDPVANIAGPMANVADVEALRERLGLADPILTQYWNYLKDLSQGSLGLSLTSQRPITTEIGERIGGTFELIILGTILAAIWGVLIGAVSVYCRRIGKVADAFSVAGLAIPDFVLGLLLTLVFAFTLGWAPSPVGQLDLAATPPPRVTGGAALDALIAGQWSIFWPSLGLLVLPVVTLGLIYGAPISRIAQGAFLETRRKAFIEYAELSGLSSTRVFRYTLRNALPSVLTLSGVVAGFLVGGIVLVEIVFAWGGLGQWAATSILSFDMPAIQAFVLLAGVFTLAVYLILDIAYGIIDPRIRMS